MLSIEQIDVLISVSLAKETDPVVFRWLNLMSKVVLKDITKIIPHRNPMIMIDNYSRIDNNNALSKKVFQNGDYGCKDGVVIDSILIECFAQTVAAHFGYQSLMNQVEKPDIGMLVSVDIFNFYHKVMATSEIEISISITDEIGPFKLIKGEILSKSQIIATGNIKGFNPENEDN